MKQCFVDTWAYLALLNRNDAGHEVAHEADEWLQAHGWVSCTSDWVLDETVTHLHVLGGAKVSLGFLDELHEQVRGRQLLIATVSADRTQAAIAWFRKLAPTVPRLSLTDCASFGLMDELDIRWAFTADRHFYSAGKRIGPLIVRDGPHLRFRPPEP